MKRWQIIRRLDNHRDVLNEHSPDLIQAREDIQLLQTTTRASSMIRDIDVKAGNETREMLIALAEALGYHFNVVGPIPEKIVCLKNRGK